MKKQNKKARKEINELIKRNFEKSNKTKIKIIYE